MKIAAEGEAIIRCVPRFTHFTSSQTNSFSSYPHTRQGIILSGNHSRPAFFVKTGVPCKTPEKKIWALLCGSLLDHFKRFERFPSYSNIFISEKRGKVIDGLLVADLTEQECCTLPHIALIIF